VSTIRPFVRSDAPPVARLYELVARAGTSSPPAGLAAYFERTLLDHPWVDDEIPSLVLEDERGEIVAFQGSHVRRAHFDGELIRIACAGQLVAHPRARARAAGARLVEAYFRGPQDLTITDGATDQMRQLWTMLGGQMAHLSCLTWTRIFAPAQFALNRRPGTPLTRLVSARRVVRAIDRIAARSGRLLPRPTAPTVAAEPLTTSTTIENLPRFVRKTRLHVAYDSPYLEWLHRELAAVEVRGQIVSQLIRDSRGERVLGWYIYYLKPGGTSEVLQIVCEARDAGSVLDHLIHHAWSRGAAAVRGRVEPRILAALSDRRILLHFTGEALVHSDSEEILGAMASGRSLVSRLDGEWWMGHHVLGFEQS
jgi:hypothetical protein